MTKQKSQQISSEIPDEAITKWQRIVNLMAKTLNVPAGLIMRVDPPQIEVFISSQTEKNPYKLGERADLKTGLYCETVMNKKKMLHVPDALKDPLWDHNPDIKLDMTCYLGFPIQWPDGKIFGTICVLDSNDNPKLIAYKEQMEEFRNTIESDLRLLDNATKIENLNQELKEQQIILEKKVNERTNDLKNKNNELIDEISRRKQSEEKFSSAFNNSPNAVILSNFETGKIYDVNKAFTSLTGHSSEKAIGNTTIGLNIWKADVSRDDLVAKMKKGSPIRDMEITFLKKSGEEFISLLTVNQLDISDRSVILSSIVDITERKKIELELIKSNKKYRNIFENALAGIGRVSIDNGRFIECNVKLANILGYDSQEKCIAEYRTADNYVNPKVREELLSILKKKGEVKSFPVQLFNADKEKIWVDYSLRIIPEKGYIEGVILEITDKKEAEEALKTAYKEIKNLKDKLQAENVYLRKSIEPGNLHKDIVGKSPQIKDIVTKALQVAPTESNVLLLGETGTGKELIAKGIHDASKRKEKTLVTVNCAAIPDTLIESELFGHEKGSFTDAHTKKIGLFEIADKSTIFLDEIGETPYNVQSKLLRVIENGEILRIGSNKPIKIDVRIIAATNQNLLSLIKDKKFREDLYYRLNVFPIELPPLRTRKQDIKLLVEKFVEDFNKQMARNITNIPKMTMDALEKYSWPGNVRELKNIIERSMITSTGNAIKIEPKQLSQTIETEMISLEDVERSHIQEVLEMTYWKISGKGGAAEILDINPSTLRTRMQKLGISKPN